MAAEAERVGATAVGGMTMGADPIACAALAAGAPVKAFFVRKDKKEHGLQRWIEGPQLEPGERCLVVEDVVTTGGSTINAIERVREEGFEMAGVVSGARPPGRRRGGDRGRGGRRALHTAHDDRRRLPGAARPRLAPRLAEPRVDQPAGDRVRRREHQRTSPRAAASISARSNQPTSASSSSPGVGSPRSATALNPSISELGKGHGCEAT